MEQNANDRDPKRITREFLAGEGDHARNDSRFEWARRPVMLADDCPPTPEHEEENPPFLFIMNRCLVGADFEGLDLKFAVFKGCDLSSARFDGCNLFKAKFMSCVLYNATFEKAVLVDVAFPGSFLFGIRLQGAEMYGACDPEDIVNREKYQGGKIAFRTTAGRSDWRSLAEARKAASSGLHGQLPRRDDAAQFFDLFGREFALTDGTWSPNGHEHDQPHGSHDTCRQRLLIPSMHELIEVINWDSADLEWRRDHEPPEESYPQSSKGSLEDSTATVFRQFRERLERMGNSKRASEFRFWEKAYLTAAKWKQVGGRGCPRIAQTLLHHGDELRDGTRADGDNLLGFFRHYAFAMAPVAGFGLIAILGINFPWPFFIVLAAAICCLPVAFHVTGGDRVNYRDLPVAVYGFMAHVFCGYGERPLRALGSLGLWVLGFAIIYFGLAVTNGGLVMNPGKTFGTWVLHAVYYSITTATTLGLGDIFPMDHTMELLTSIEIAGATVFMALFIATLARSFIER